MLVDPQRSTGNANIRDLIPHKMQQGRHLLNAATL